MLMLPNPVKHCPREKPCPEPKPETRWEKFAKEKGIKKRKRERMVWDKDTESWRPRYGYKRDGEMKDWVIPLKKTDPDSIDKYEEKRLTKKGKILKNELNRIRNFDKAAAKSNKGKKKTVNIPAGIPTALGVKRPLKGNSERAKKSKRGMKAAESSLNQVQVSTASMGQFDTTVAGEGRKGRGTKRQYIDNQNNTKTRDMELLALTLSGNLPPDRKKLQKSAKRPERGVARKGGKGRKKKR
jgi:regulator of ribosome biosynthesis